MARQIGEVLKELGWTDGFHVPVADDTNKALEAEVEAKLKKKAALSSEIEALTDRLNAITKHRQNVTNEHKENQGLITAHRNQIQSLDDQYRLKNGERMRIDQERRQAEKQRQDTEERIRSMDNDLQRHGERVEELKRSVKWDKDALLAWEEEVIRGDDDNTMIAKFSAEDEAKAKALDVRRQRLYSESDKCNELLMRMIDEVRGKELELEKTAQLYRKGHDERQQLIRQWEHVVRVLHQRDRDINNAREEMSLLKTLARDKLDVLQEVKNFHSSHVETNAATDRQITATGRQVQRIKDTLIDRTQLTDQLTNELNMMKRLVPETGRRLQAAQSENNRLRDELAANRVRRDELTSLVAELKAKRDEINNKSMTAAERAKQLDNLVEAEEKRLSSLDHSINRLSNLLFKYGTLLFDERKKAELLAIELSSVETNKRRVRVQANEIAAEVERQKEIVYGLDFKACSIRSRIDRVAGEEKLDDDIEEKEQKAVELEATLAEKMVTFNLLTSQLTRLDEDMRRLTSAISADQTELSRLTSQRQGKLLLVEGGAKQLKAGQSRCHERQVEENVLKLRVRQADNNIKRIGDKVYSLERQKLELEEAMRERQVEISAHTDVLKQRKRALDEENSRLNVEIKHCEGRTEQLQKRYDINMGSLGKDEDGEQLTVTKFKIKAIQEKYLLQEEGDALDSKIRRAEREILAMENTLKVVNATNDTYKQSLSTVEKEDPEYAEKLELDSEYLLALDRLRHRRSQQAELQREVQAMVEKQEELQREAEEQRQEWRDKEQALGALNKELTEQRSKLARAEKQLRRLQKEVRAASDPNVKTLEERDLDVREQLEQNMSALQQLSELVTRHIEAGPVLTRYLDEKNLSLPLVHSSRRKLDVQSACSRASLASDRSASALSVASATPSVVTIDPFDDNKTPGRDPNAPRMICGSTAHMGTRPVVGKLKMSITKPKQKKS